MKKILSIILVLFILFATGTIVACDNSNATQNSDNESTTSVEIDWRDLIIEEMMEWLKLRALVEVPTTNGYVTDFWLNKIYSESGDASRYNITGRFCVSTSYGYVYYNTFDVTASFNFETSEVELLSHKLVDEWRYTR